MLTKLVKQHSEWNLEKDSWYYLQILKLSQIFVILYLYENI